jgi:GT2 family glycosyltransferase
MSVEQTGAVIIGRNEGERLRASIQSVLPQAARVVYVDSGSADGSVALAQSFGCDVIELTSDRPFTAARGRNAGYRHLLTHASDLHYIQFIDGDCTLDESWMIHALAKMGQDEKIAVVCGRRRERFPNATIYNLQCDMEWNTPIGRADACGGDALMRVAALRDVNGFDESFAAGEEPEMCFRMQMRGWQVWRIDAEMTCHNAAMTRFSQWWTRSTRAGSAYAQSAYVHGGARYNVRQTFSIWLWAVIVPIVILIGVPFSAGLSLTLLLLYPVLAWRVYRWRRGIGDPVHDAAVYAVFTLIGKWANLVGQVRFWRTRESKLIEYKSAEAM